MIDFILLALVILILLVIKSHYAIVIAIYLAYLIIYNSIFISCSDALANAFSIAIPAICLICSIWVCNREHTLYHPKLFFISMVLFVFCAINAFCSTDALSMFMYMEASMIPMMLMMLSEHKCKNVNIVYQYLIYTFISACLLLVAIIQISIDSKSYSFVPTREWCYWLIALASAIKLPMFPFHYWVPTVHGKSSIICSIMLASVCLKYSSLIIVRFLLPLPSFTQYIILSGILSAVCTQYKYSQYKQSNLKIVFAYSSIIHMNLYLFILLASPYSYCFIYSLIAHSITMVLAFMATDIEKGRMLISNKSWILVLISSLCLTSIPGSVGFLAEICALHNSNIVNPTMTVLLIILIIISSCRIMNLIFKRKEVVVNYHLHRLKTTQIVVIILIITLIVIGGVVPFFKFP